MTEPAAGYSTAFRTGDFLDHSAPSLVCGKCGARRVDRQIGLENTPDEWCDRLVQVFREARRVLADHGTFWLEVGDSYNANVGAGFNANARIGHQDTRRPTGLKPKDLLGQPWLLAFALRADGWWLRQCIIWAKPNAMPESARDRCTTAHSYVFLLSKRPRYWYDADSIAEPSAYAGEQLGVVRGQKRRAYANGRTPSGNESPERAYAADAIIHGDRNARSVWTIPTQGYPGAHYATWPIALATRMIRAGCPREVCRVCGTPRTRIVDVTYEKSPVHGEGSVVGRHYETGANNYDGSGMPRLNRVASTSGWTDCGHNDYRPGRVLDPFGGSGTTGVAALREHRHAVLIELNEAYVTDQMIPRLRDWHKEPTRTRDDQIDGQTSLLELLDG